MGPTGFSDVFSKSMLGQTITQVRTNSIGFRGDGWTRENLPGLREQQGSGNPLAVRGKRAGAGPGDPQGIPLTVGGNKVHDERGVCGFLGGRAWRTAFRNTFRGHGIP